MKILFVCSVNRMRSATADTIFSEMYPQHEIKSCGTDTDSIMEYIEWARHSGEKIYDKPTPISRQLVEWADIIIVMENHHKQDIARMFGNGFDEKISVLHIKDIYYYMNTHLIEKLKNKVVPIINEHC